MTNRYYNESFTAAIGQLAQSGAIDAQFRAITAGFDLIQKAIDTIQGLAGITDLSGFPASFSGQAGKYAVVNTAESAIEFVSGAAPRERGWTRERDSAPGRADGCPA
jgi:hypothetical protein